MKRYVFIGLAILLASSTVLGASTPWTTKVKAGEDEELTVNFGGRIMVDYNFADEEIWDDEAGNELRRARFFAAGSMFDNIKFKLQVDFANLGQSAADSTEITLSDGTTEDVLTKDGKSMEIKDAYIAMTDTAVGQILIGNRKVPFSLGSETSSRYITFVERALPLAVANPKREVGVYVSDKVMEKRLSYIVGTFRDSGNGYSTGTDGVGYGGRIGSLPIQTEDRALFLGASIWDQDPGEVEINPHPELHMVPKLVTDSLEVDGATVYALESGFTCGPVHLAAEYMSADLDATEGGEEMAEDATASGYYVQAGVFLTGEHRKIDSVAWKRVKPKENFAAGNGLGAWELKARFSSLDLDDGGMMGGEEDNVTVGLNWYLNPHTAVKFDYVLADATYADPEKDDVDGDGGVVRFQIDF